MFSGKLLNNQLLAFCIQSWYQGHRITSSHISVKAVSVNALHMHTHDCIYTYTHQLCIEPHTHINTAHAPLSHSASCIIIVILCFALEWVEGDGGHWCWGTNSWGGGNACGGWSCRREEGGKGWGGGGGCLGHHLSKSWGANPSCCSKYCLANINHLHDADISMVPQYY